MRSSIAPVLLLLALPGRLSPQVYENGIQQVDVASESSGLVFVLAGRLWVGSLDGGVARRLSTPGGRVSAPVMGPGGDQVFYLQSMDQGRTTALQHFDIESGDARRVWSTPEHLRDFDVDFERAEVVISVEGKGLQVLSSDGSGLRPLTSGSNDRLARVSPDGRSVAFLRSAGDSQDIWILDRASGEVRRVQGTIRVQENFDWSPDGRAFVLESLDTGNLELWTLPTTGGAGRRITAHVAMDHRPSWIADGRICFHRNRQFWCQTPGADPVSRIALTARLEPPDPSSIRIRNARLLDVGEGVWVEGRDLLIVSGSISGLLTPGQPTPDGVDELDARGLYVIPGLIDSHTHYEPWMAGLMVAHGVSLMRNLGFAGGTDWILDERDFTRDGHLEGPQILAAGVVMNGSGPATIGQVRSEDPRQVSETVTWLAEQGVDLIKVGSENTWSLLESTIAAARRHDLPVWGHVALVSPQAAVAMGQDGIEHLRGMAWYSLPVEMRPVPVPRRLTGMRQEGAAWWDVDPDRVRELAARLARQGAGLDPTLTVMAYIGDPNPTLAAEIEGELPTWIVERWRKGRLEGPVAEWGVDDFRAFSAAEQHQREFVDAYNEAGGLITTGSDVGVDWVVPGLSLHQEMARLVGAGLTPLEAIRAATSNGAEAARLQELAGSLEEGKWGNAVILAGDPLRDITNTRSIRYVIQMGEVVFEKGIRPGSD